MQSIESTGKTLDEAIRSGLVALGVEREAVTVEIIQNPKSGFFGLGSTLARVKLTLAASETKPQSRPQQPAHFSQPAQQPRAFQPAQNAPQRRPSAPAQSAPSQQRPAPKAEPARSEAPKQRRQPRPSTPATAEHLKLADDFVKGLLVHLNMDVTYTSKLADEAVHITLEGENIGNLIGRRGDTLDAIQHLVAHVVNMGGSEFSIKVHVDAADYRRKRQEALEQLAQRMAANAIKYRSNMTLEPMNAYERHIIHVALQDTPGISTFSTGSEPQRRVVIAFQRPGGRGPGGGSGNGRSGPRRDSFERDSNTAHGHRNNTRPASQAFGTPREFPPRSKTFDASQTNTPSAPKPAAPVHATPAAPAPTAPAPTATTSSAPTQPRSLPVREFGVKKNNREGTE